MHRYNAQYLMNDGSTVTIVGIPHRPDLGTAQKLPDRSDRYGKVVAVERDWARCCMRQPAWGPVIDFSGY